MPRIGPGLAGLCLVALLTSTDAPPAPQPTDLGMWFWHSPFRVSPSEEKQLKELGVGTLYVRGGTFTTDGKRVLLRFKQRYEGQTSLRTVLVLNFDGGVVRHLEELPRQRVSDDVNRGIDEAMRAARETGIKPSGIQLDLDCPTRLLPLYAELLRSVKERRKEELSITALPTWIGSPSFPALCKQVGFVAPQFYENRTGKTLADLQPIGDIGELKRGLRTLERLKVPYRIGVPAYGHSLLYDEAGRLYSMYRDLSLRDALKHPALKFERTRRVGGEQLVVLRAGKDGDKGKGKDFRLAYTVPTPDLVGAYVDAIESADLRYSRGSILYRFPQKDESMTLPLASLRAGLRRETPVARLTPKLQVVNQPWSVIDGGDSEPAREVAVSLTNSGTSATLPGEDAKVLILLDRPGIEAVRRGDFDLSVAGRWDEATGSVLPSSLARADAVVLSCTHLVAGQEVSRAALVISPLGARRAKVRWRAVDAARGAALEGETLVEVAK